MDFFLKSDTIYHGKKRAKMVKLASISSGVLCRDGQGRVFSCGAGQRKVQNLWVGAKRKYLS